MKALLFKYQLSRRWKVFLITWLAYAGFYLCRKNFSVAMPFFSHMGMSNMQLANIITVYSIMYMLGQFVSGFLNDRLGAKVVVGVGLFIAVAANLCIGFYASSFFLFVFMFLNGAGQSTGWSGLMRIMSDWFEKKERGVVMGWWTTCYVVGGIVSVIFATWWATNSILPGLSWRKAFWAPALLLLIITILFWKFVREKPHGQPGGNFSGSTVSSSSSVKKIGRDLKGVFPILKDSTLWIAAIVYFITKFIRYTFLFWIPLYLSQTFGYSNADAGYTSSVFELAGFAGILVAGYLSDKMFNSARFSVSALFFFVMGLILMFQPKLTSLGNMGNIFLIALCGFFIYGPDSLISAAGAMDIGNGNTGVAAGFINGVGSIGQLLSPCVVAYVSGKYGWKTLFSVFVWLVFIAGILLAIKWNYGRIDRQGKELKEVVL